MPPTPTADPPRTPTPAAEPPPRSGWSRVPRTVWVLAAARFVSGTATFVAVYLFLYLTGPRGLSLTAAGLISGAVGAGMLAGTFTGGWFSDRFGHRRTMLVASTIGGLSLLAVPWLPIGVLAVTMPLGSYATGTADVAQSALVAEAVPAGDRRTAIAITRAASNAGFVIGPPLGALLASVSYTWLFVVQALVMLTVRQVAARLLPAAPTRKAAAPSDGGLWASLRAGRTLLLFLPAVLLADLVYRQLYSTLPVYLRDSGHGVGLYATLIAVGSGVILCLEIPVTLALRRLPSLRIIATGYLLVGAGFGLLGVSTSTWVLVIAMLVVTAGEILYKTTATAHVVDAAPPQLLARYQGLYTGASISGVVLAPPIGAFTYAISPASVWPLCTAVAVIAAGLALWSGRSRGPGRRWQAAAPRSSGVRGSQDATG
ncbi:MFS transporter [Stackebrandtia nassauensis]|uniref:Major facilitator superfamily MFS_1 n=1 Tax=Stackebrandtia nassauensis (strain DSM 44728 / CIP 108903 / NRRL B-16338 / NBRC 102104 / LLR-40K-21) TaxID=446470 RepID=D3PXA3_STANL|nr:MFS transporter [Stackebrandtia nassauensis]ADD41366.1 major facilitator superfamily MFS_1 [Stackebrandtia nassauensis DSM 44728]